MSDPIQGAIAPPLPHPRHRVAKAIKVFEAIEAEVISKLNDDDIPEMIDELEEDLVVVQLAIMGLYNRRDRLIAAASKEVAHEI